MHFLVLASSRRDAASLDEALAASPSRATWVVSLGEATAAMRRFEFDAVVVVDQSPGADEARDWLQAMPTQLPPGLPVLVLGHPEGLPLVTALCLGASDYSQSAPDLVARLEARARARQQSRRESIRLGDLVLDVELLAAHRAGVDCELTSREFALVFELARHAGEVVSLHALSLKVWGRSIDISKRTIEQHVYTLRRKLRLDGQPGNRIQAIYGRGYVLDLRTSTPASAPPAVLPAIPAAFAADLR